MHKLLGTLLVTSIPLSTIGFAAEPDPIPPAEIESDSCTIVVGQVGKLHSVANLKRLTSRFGQGVPGIANITTSENNLAVSVQEPISFDLEPAGDLTSPETFRAWHRSTGATVYGLTRNPRPINEGLSTILIHLDARKTAGGTFAGGNYSATVVLRCE